mgnify:CR=1 FL=1
MSEENKWGTGLPDDDKNVSAEQKPLTHPYSEGRRMQESGQNSDAGAGQSEGVSQEKTKYGHYEVHQPQAGNYAGGNIPPKKPRKKRDFSGNNSFGKKAATAVALAVIFGLVAGAVFQGVNIAADKYRGNDSSTTIGKTETVTGTEDSTGSSSADSTVKDIVAESGTVAGVAHATMSSIVAITSVSVQEIPSFFGYGTRQYQSAGSGSGIIVGENDSELLIATNNHVVSGATTLTVCFAGSDVVGAEEETQAMASSGSTGFGSDGDVDVDNAVSAKIKGTDEENDLAVVAVEKSDIPNETMEEIKIAQLGSSDDLVVGEQVVAIGNALGYGQSVTSGWISALNRTISTDDMTGSGLIQTDAAINPGNSGGALLNMNGEVIGINSAKFASNAVEGMGYAIPISRAQPILEDLMSRETRDKVDGSEASYLGINPLDLSAEVTAMFDMPEGVFVSSVSTGEAADNAGIRKGDIITGFDGQTVTGRDDLNDKMKYYAAGETVDITIARAQNGQYVEQTVQVTLGNRPDAD